MLLKSDFIFEFHPHNFYDRLPITLIPKWLEKLVEISDKMQDWYNKYLFLLYHKKNSFHTIYTRKKCHKMETSCKFYFHCSMHALVFLFMISPFFTYKYNGNAIKITKNITTLVNASTNSQEKQR